MKKPTGKKILLDYPLKHEDETCSRRLTSSIDMAMDMQHGPGHAAWM
jgi:hypothetical protein